MYRVNMRRIHTMLGQRRRRWSNTGPSLCRCTLSNTGRWPSVGLMLVHRLRRWPNIKTTMSGVFYVDGDFALHKVTSLMIYTAPQSTLLKRYIFPNNRAGPVVKDSYSCEMRMCGTVKCRPTLAYRVHSINIRLNWLQDTTPTRNRPNAVLMLYQRLRRWPTLNQHLVSVPCWLGKLLLICHCGMSRGHCCILGTTLSRVFWQLTTPLKLPAWKGSDRGFAPSSGVQVSKKQNFLHAHS